MRVLLDTCALIELRNPEGNLAVKTAVALMADDDIYLSVLIVGEIARGITRLQDGRKKRNLSAWLTGLEGQFADRILPVDTMTAHMWGEISVHVQQAKLTLPAVDGLLAATALQHGLHLMTHGTPIIRATGALIVDPWNES